MAKINGDVIVDFRLMQGDKEISSGHDTIYLAEFEEKVESTKIYIPRNLSSGSYDFIIEVSFEKYKASSHRTIYVEQGENQLRQVSLQQPKSSNYYIWLLLLLLIITIVFALILYIKLERIQDRVNNFKEKRKKKKELKRYVVPEEIKEKKMTIGHYSNNKTILKSVADIMYMVKNTLRIIINLIELYFIKTINQIIRFTKNKVKKYKLVNTKTGNYIKTIMLKFDRRKKLRLIIKTIVNIIDSIKKIIKSFVNYLIKFLRQGIKIIRKIINKLMWFTKNIQEKKSIEKYLEKIKLEQNDELSELEQIGLDIQTEKKRMNKIISKKKPRKKEDEDKLKINKHKEKITKKEIIREDVTKVPEEEESKTYNVEPLIDKKTKDREIVRGLLKAIFKKKNPEYCKEEHHSKN